MFSISTAAANIPIAKVMYTSNSQSTVSGALDNLFTLVNNQYFDLATAKANTAGKIFANKKGVCISRSKTVYCFRINNWSTEKNIQNVFSDVRCDVDLYNVTCNASDFNCEVYSDGAVYYLSDGSVNCS